MLSDLDSIIQPVEEATGLPNDHYVNPQIHQLEKKSLFFDTWAGLSVTANVPNIGDVKPVTFFNVPLLIVRNKNGGIRVFQNICRHRGMTLISEEKNIEGAIRCPYHSWCYSTDGRLIATPHVGGAGRNTHRSIKKDNLGLIEVRSHIWMDVIFINMSGTAPSFQSVNKQLIERWKEFDQPIYHGGLNSKFTLTVNCNWKLAVENYCESYHLPWVHPGLNSYSKLEDHYNIENPDIYSGQGTYLYKQYQSLEGTFFPSFQNLSRKWDLGAEYITVFPNVLMACQKDHVWSAVLSPKSHDSTVEEINIYYGKPDICEDMKKNNMELWKGIFLEDIFVVEGMQNGRNCFGFDGGKFSPVMDGPTHLFHVWVAKNLIIQQTA